MDSPTSKLKDNGVALALDIKNVKWAGQQMWASDLLIKTVHIYFIFQKR
jgi:hypothetical protein